MTACHRCKTKNTEHLTGNTGYIPIFTKIIRNLFGCSGKMRYLCTRNQETHRGVEQLVARQAHNLEVVRSSRASATQYKRN